MAFGLTGAPGTFQRAMNTTLVPLLRKYVLVFFDDILVYNSSFEDHLHHMHQVFELLAAEQWKIKLSKGSFAQNYVSYLGHVISQYGVSTDPEKVVVVASWPTPHSVKELHSFLGLARYYRKFVRHFSIISRPLTNLLEKVVMFVWTEEHEKAFATLKTTMVQAPVLSLHGFTKTFVIEIDAGDYGIRAVLMQEGHPLAYLSKALGPKSRGLSTYEKKYMAILIAIQYWRPYLQQVEFHILTNHKSLSQLNEQRLHTNWQHKVFTKLLGLQYKVIYKKGAENRVADALSCRAHETPELCLLSTRVPQWV
jgi:hypothetical protein